MNFWQHISDNLQVMGLGRLMERLTGTSTGNAPPDQTKSQAFTLGVIVLGAKLAKADGQVTRDEVAAFKQVFKVPPEDEIHVGRLFNRARQDAHGFEPYARQLGRLFKNDPHILEHLLACLFHIARADGRVSDDEVNFLEAVALKMGLSQNDFWLLSMSCWMGGGLSVMVTFI